MSDSSPPASTGAQGPPPGNRRSFLASLAAFFGSTLALLVPLAVGVNHLLHPLRLRRRRKGPRVPFVPVAPLDQVPDDGRPRRFPVVQESWNQWTYRPQVPVGSVYLVRRKGEQVPQAFNSRCPHAGCTVGLGSGEGEVAFLCPCHKARFQLDGTVITPSPSPRSLDELPCRVEEGMVVVQFQNFVVGVQEKIPET